MWTPHVRVALVREPLPQEQTRRVHGPGDVDRLARQFLPGDDPRERFVAFALDTQNRPVAAHTVSVGLLNSALVHPREVFCFAILACAASIVIAHNHPSGDVEPSPEDLEVTWQLVEAGRIIGIPVRDHVIIGGEGRYKSLLEIGLIGRISDKAADRGNVMTKTLEAIDARKDARAVL